jgi:hypothetical protein
VTASYCRDRADREWLTRNLKAFAMASAGIFATGIAFGIMVAREFV